MIRNTIRVLFFGEEGKPLPEMLSDYPRLCAHRSLLMIVRKGPCELPGIKTGLTMCNGSALSTILPLQPPPPNIILTTLCCNSQILVWILSQEFSPVRIQRSQIFLLTIAPFLQPLHYLPHHFPVYMVPEGWEWCFLRRS